MVTEQQIKLARDKFKEISGITIYTPDEGSLDDFEQSRYDGLVAALEAALSAAEPDELYNADALMNDGGDNRQTAAEEVLTYLLIEVVGAPDDVPYSANRAGVLIEERLKRQPAPAVAVKLDSIAHRVHALARMVGTSFFDDIEKDLRSLSAALSAQVQDVAGWQPIETAPEDGTDVLLSSPHWHGDVVVGCWSFEGWRDRDDSDKLEPTHWMPLPAAPAKQEGE